MKHGAALRHKVALASRILQAPTRGAGAGEESDALLPELLFRTHCVARASVPLMQAARLRSLELSAVDPVAQGMTEYLAEHIEEELAHAEWVLEDLEEMGCAREVILARSPPATIAELVGAQYYWIHHAHPVALLAYIAVLEQHVTPGLVLRDLLSKSRHAPAAFRTLLEHAERDPSHVADLYALLDRLPLSPGQVSLLSVNAFRTVELLDRSFDELWAGLAASGQTA
jgi:hypothetical protein